MSPQRPDHCPYCGGSDFIVGKQQGYGSVSANKAFTFKQQPLYHLICSQCGTVVRSFVNNPELLKD